MRYSSSHEKPKLVITTSWDDGHPLDLKVAELLAKHGFRGTFYVPARYQGHSVLNPAEINELVKLGMEVGSHTLSHTVLTELSVGKIQKELVGSKNYLEDILGKDVISFCYPKGRFNKVVRSKVIEAGYCLGRTTVGFRTNAVFDPFCMPVSFQFYPHGKWVQWRHALKEKNFSGLLNYVFRYRLITNLDDLSRSMLASVIGNGGILHFWGHSWEIQENDLWPTLENVLHSLSGQVDVSYLTNSQILGC